MKLRVVACFFALYCVLSATTIVPVSVERLAQESSHVLEATALSSWSQWNAQHTLIFTYTRFRVAHIFKGQAPATVVVRQLGGSSEGFTQKVAGVRHWRAGDEVVLFLYPSKSADGSFEVTGLMQGNFAVLTRGGQKVVNNGVRGVVSYSETSTHNDHANNMSLSELESRVQEAGRR